MAAVVFADEGGYAEFVEEPCSTMIVAIGILFISMIVTVSLSLMYLYFTAVSVHNNMIKKGGR